MTGKIGSVGYNSSGRRHSVGGGGRLCKIIKQMHGLLVADDTHWPPVLWSQTCWQRKLQSKLEKAATKMSAVGCGSGVFDCDIGLHVQSSYSVT